jgi:hypothetical protein
MFPTLILSSFVSGSLPEEMVDRIVSTRTVVVQRQMLVSAAIYTGDPLGSIEAGTMKALTRPIFSTHHKQTCWFQNSQENRAIQIKVTPQLRLDGNIGMDCETTLSTPAHATKPGDSFIPAVDTQAMKINAVLTPGERIEVRLSAKSATDQTWMELEAKVVESPITMPPPPQPAPVHAASATTPSVAYFPHRTATQPALVPPPPLPSLPISK